MPDHNPSIQRTMARAAALGLLLVLSACNGFYTGLNPTSSDTRKESGPLTVPPALQRSGAR